MSFEDYKKGVIAEYKRRKEANELSPNLSNPSPGKIKSECLIVYDERYLLKDDAVLRLFFGARDQESDYRKKIEKFEVDGYRPLVSLLRDKIKNSDEKNVKLLSWLIDFDNKEAMREEEDAPPPEEAPKLPQFNIKKAVAMFFIFAIASMGTYLVLKDASSNSESEKCMYWDGDEYLQVSCTQKLPDKLIIALDSVQLDKLKKITKPDTITHNSIGKVWYAKSKGRVEFYTSGGNHPVEINKRLLPITDYIINKYVPHL